MSSTYTGGTFANPLSRQNQCSFPTGAIFLPQGEAFSHTVTAQHSSARVEGLKAGTAYTVQVRARTVAGYGRYSFPAEFSTNEHSRNIVLFLSLSLSLSLLPHDLTPGPVTSLGLPAAFSSPGMCVTFYFNQVDSIARGKPKAHS